MKFSKLVYPDNFILYCLDFVDQNNDYEIPEDDMPYLSLMYANGPGYVSPRTNLTNTNIKGE